MFKWHKSKNEKLKLERGISFERIVYLIENGGLVQILEHPNQEKYPNQKMFFVNHNNYIHVVPFEEKEDSIFLKTIYPSGKYTRKLLRRSK